jgi:hypothetical protein
MSLLLYVRLGIYNCWYVQTREQMLNSKKHHSRIASCPFKYICDKDSTSRILQYILVTTLTAIYYAVSYSNVVIKIILTFSCADYRFST